MDPIPLICNTLDLITSTFETLPHDQAEGNNGFPALPEAQLLFETACSVSRAQRVWQDSEIRFYSAHHHDVELRQSIEKQLNKGESGNKFSKAISFGNNHDFLYGEKVQQEIAEGCRRLIKNAIICWNYLYLSHKIAKEEDAERREELLEAVKNGSVANWRHVNLHGEYDFSEEKMQDSVGLEMPPSLVFNLS